MGSGLRKIQNGETLSQAPPSDMGPASCFLTTKRYLYKQGNQVFYSLCSMEVLGKDGCAKSDGFSEKFQTTFDPTPPFTENYVAIFL